MELHKRIVKNCFWPYWPICVCLVNQSQTKKQTIGEKANLPCWPLLSGLQTSSMQADILPVDDINIFNSILILSRRQDTNLRPQDYNICNQHNYSRECPIWTAPHHPKWRMLPVYTTFPQKLTDCPAHTYSTYSMNSIYVKKWFSGAKVEHCDVTFLRSRK